jgi:hypothetical protein
VYFKLVLFIWYHFTEQQRGTERVLRKVGRDIERDRRGLDKEEKKLVSLKGSSVLSVGNLFSTTSGFFSSYFVGHIAYETGIRHFNPHSTSNLDYCITRQLGLLTYLLSKMVCRQKLLSLIFSLKHNMPNCWSVKDRSSIFCFL